MCYRFQYSTLGSHLIRQNLADAEFEDVTLKANKRLKPSQIHQLKHELKPLVILDYNDPEQFEQGIKLISEWGD